MELLINNVRKSYGKVLALDGIDMRLNNGIYGLIGPNGSGKSTLMKIITRNLAYDSGSITCDGTAIEKLGRDFLCSIGYMPQESPLYPQLTVYEFLSYMSAVKGLEKNDSCRQINSLLEELSLTYAAGRRISALSGGMRQRVCFAQALLGDPKLLILDEPTAGLDPAQRVAVRSMMARIASERTVLLATHVISDVESVAKELLFISKGRIIKAASPSKLIAKISGRVFTVEASRHAELTNAKVIALATSDGIDRLRIITDSPPAGAQEAEATLEDYYLDCLS